MFSQQEQLWVSVASSLYQFGIFFFTFIILLLVSWYLILPSTAFLWVCFLLRDATNSLLKWLFHFIMQLVIPKLLIPLHIPLCSLLKYDSYFLRFPCSWAWPWGPDLASEQKCGLQGKHFPLRRKNRIFIHFTYMNVNMFPEVMAVILWPWGDQRGTRRQYARERRTVRHWGTSVWLSLW